jgi:hypothetical protein
MDPDGHEAHESELLFRSGWNSCSLSEFWIVVHQHKLMSASADIVPRIAAR